MERILIEDNQGQNEEQQRRVEQFIQREEDQQLNRTEQKIQRVIERQIYPEREFQEGTVHVNEQRFIYSQDQLNTRQRQGFDEQQVVRRVEVFPRQVFSQTQPIQYQEVIREQVLPLQQTVQIHSGSYGQVPHQTYQTLLTSGSNRKCIPCEWKARYHDLLPTLDALNREIQELRAENFSLRNAQQNIEKLIKDNQTYQSLIEKFEREKIEFANHFNNFEKDKSGVGLQIQALQSKLSEADQALGQKDQDLAKLKNELEHYLSVNKNLITELDELRGSINDWKGKFEKQKKKKKKLKKTIKEEQDAHEEKLKNLVTQYEQAKSELNQDKAKLRETISKKSEEITQQKNENQQLSKEITDLESFVKVQSDNLRQKDEIINNFESKKLEYETKLRREQEESLLVERGRFQKFQETLEQQIDQLTFETRKLQTELQNSDSLLKQKSNKIEELERIIAQQQTDYFHLQQQPPQTRVVVEERPVYHRVVEERPVIHQVIEQQPIIHQVIEERPIIHQQIQERQTIIHQPTHERQTIIQHRNFSPQRIQEEPPIQYQERVNYSPNQYHHYQQHTHQQTRNQNTEPTFKPTQPSYDSSRLKFDPKTVQTQYP